MDIDEKGKKNGRGAYVCKDINCLKKTEKSRALQRALECEIRADFFAVLAEKLNA